MSAVHHTPASPHPLARFLAVLGALACVIITAAIWKSVSAYQEIWLLPGLYFIELPALAIFSAIMFVRHLSSGYIAWGSLGALIAFCILGAWSVGFLYLPVALLLSAACLVSDMRSGNRLPGYLAVCLLAALAQAALMLMAVRWLSA